MRWFEKVVQYLDKADFKSPIQGFGVSAPTIIEEYPLSSVDSSSLVLGSAYGQVFIFDPDKEPKFKSYYVSSLEEKKVKKENLDYVLERTRVEAFKVDRDGLDEHWTRLLISFNNWLEYVNYLKKKKRRILWSKPINTYPTSLSRELISVALMCRMKEK